MDHPHCPHPFDCRYRTQGKCCHAMVEDVSTCQEGQQITASLTPLPRTNPFIALAVQRLKHPGVPSNFTASLSIQA